MEQDGEEGGGGGDEEPDIPAHHHPQRLQDLQNEATVNKHASHRMIAHPFATQSYKYVSNLQAAVILTSLMMWR